MHVRAVLIENFRGIRKADIRLPGGLVCLLGPGDATKTTLLDAIEWTIGNRWRLSVADSDFYRGTTAEPIRIAVTVGALSKELISFDAFGSRLRGISAEGVIHDEPRHGDEEVVTIQLTIDDSLEPEWVVFRVGESEGHRVSARAREKLGLVRCADDAGRDLFWSRGSLLARFSGKDSGAATSVIAAVAREARSSFSPAALSELQAVSRQIEKLASSHCVALSESLGPHLDPAHLTSMRGALCLHEGETPFRLRGQGSRRALALALFSEMIKSGDIGLVDEFEVGLEPYRVRALIRRLRAAAESGNGQLIITTYSPQLISLLAHDEVRLVRSRDGITSLTPVPDKTWPKMRDKPDTLLCRKIVVCEGKTEHGLLEEWDSQGSDQLSLAMNGVAAVVGGGASTGDLALRFASIDLPTAILGDSDTKLSSQAKLRDQKVEIRLWADGFCTEQRLCADLPWPAVRSLPTLAGGLQDQRRILSALQNEVSGITSIDAWNAVTESDEHRRAVARAAVKGSWFKSVDGGRALGRLVASCWTEIDHRTDLATTLMGLGAWIRK